PPDDPNGDVFGNRTDESLPPIGIPPSGPPLPTALPDVVSVPTCDSEAFAAADPVPVDRPPTTSGAPGNMPGPPASPPEPCRPPPPDNTFTCRTNGDASANRADSVSANTIKPLTNITSRS